MNYYDNIYEIPENDMPELKGYYFKISRIKPTKIYAISMTFAKVMDPKSPADPDALEKVADFIVDSLQFSTSKNGPFVPVHKPGLDSFELSILEENPMCLVVFTSLYFENVIQKAQNI